FSAKSIWVRKYNHVKNSQNVESHLLHEIKTGRNKSDRLMLGIGIS
ncbi:36245_t:CDS:2, partial [Racocetra persica]